MKTALITGITGQDGAYLAAFLLSKGYRVVGLQRRTSNFLDSRWRLRHLDIEDKLAYAWGDMTDPASLSSAIRGCRPDEIYNLAAQSFVGTSWVAPEATAQVVGVGALNLLEAARQEMPSARIYQAGSSEMFGKVQEPMQSERTPFYPRSPYGCAKVFAHWAAINYRESYNMFVANGILFNHESPLRGAEFVTQKICQGAARCALGQAKTLRLGNLKARRDWGHAADYVRGMWLMLQHPTPQEFVLATGRTASVADFCEQAFGALNMDWTKYVEVDEALVRPAEVDVLLGNPLKAERELEWRREYTLGSLIREMVGEAWLGAVKELGHAGS